VRVFPQRRRCVVLSPASPKLLHSRKILSENLNNLPNLALQKVL